MSENNLSLSRRRLLGVLSSGLVVPASASQSPQPDGLERAFQSPPDSAKPWVYWFWLNGNLSREGMTADLEAMQRAGIGGALIMSIAAGIGPGPVRFLTPEWRDLFRHMVSEADRLGLVIDMNNDDGWDCGGPWIKPEYAMQRLVWTETRIEGPRKFTGTLPQPPAKLDYYRDVAVLAFPTPAGDEESPPTPPVTRKAGNPPYLEIEFPQPFTARAVTVSAEGPPAGKPRTCELQVSSDGASYRTVHLFETGWEGLAPYGSVTAGCQEATGRYYRLLMPGADFQDKGAERFRFDLLGGARVSLWELKAGFANVREHGGGSHLFETGERHTTLPPAAVIRHESVIDLTGRTEWDVSAGHWTLLRIGHTPTGALNGAATTEGKGLDCDKLSRAGVEAHFPGMMAKLIEDVKPLVGKSLKYFHNDSWESACQNWTARFPEEFRKRRGYDLLRYLPVMAGGRVVDSPEVSERFLWDVRRTIADLMTEYYWGALGELCHAHGVQYSVESAGRQQFLYNPVTLLATGDLPMGEFWMNEQWIRPDCKLAASTAHIHGKKVAGAEAFTCTTGPGGEWKAHPFWLKARGDKAFCHGINRFVFHRYVHQPYLDRKPGVGWPRVGTNIERTQTWWEPGAAWLQYLARCQFLLQQGLFVGDICCLTGEGVPTGMVRPSRKQVESLDASTITEATLTRAGAMPPVPPGYDFDACNPELVTSMTVKDGRLVLPSGMSYHVLVLPQAVAMTPALLTRVKELLDAGATLMGPKPAASPSLTDYPNSDEQVRRLADQIWGNCDGKKVLEHPCGKGKVVWGRPMPQVLAGMGVKPDFEFKGRADAELDYIHRKDGEAEIYFVSNQKERFEEVECTFRVTGKAPEIWHPDTGRVDKLVPYTQKDGRTRVPLHMDPAGSLFVVFREPTRKSALAVRRSRKGQTLTIAGPWEVRFPAGWGAPEKIVLQDLISWPKHAEDGVKYFSGTATYVKDLDIPAAMISPGRVLLLDLGAVKEMAGVTINGKDLGVVWKPPYSMDISGAAVAGANRLEMKVTNLWPNRMIGDQHLPESKRYTWTTWTPFPKETPLLESGLLGPVTLRNA